MLDGDSGRPIAGARVTVGSRTTRTDAHGVALLVAPRDATMLTRVVAQGFPQDSALVSFRRTPRYGFTLYKPALQWPMYGADAARTQAQTQIHLRPPFRVVWSRSLHGLIEFPAVVSSGQAYVGNAQGTVYAIDMSTGNVLWRSPTPGGKMAASPAVFGNLLVVHEMNGQVRLLRRRDGHVERTYEIGAPIESSPIVRDGVDYFGSWDGVVEALELRSGHVRWRFPSGCKITSSASISASASAPDPASATVSSSVWAFNSCARRRRASGSSSTITVRMRMKPPGQGLSGRRRRSARRLPEPFPCGCGRRDR